MADNDIACPKCSQRMLEGFLPYTVGRGSSVYSQYPIDWAAGKPVRGWLGSWGGLRMRGRVRVPVTAYRCASCGYVEIYAK
jgi:hypothetical protein